MNPERNIAEKQDSFDVEYRIFTGDGKCSGWTRKPLSRGISRQSNHIQGIVVDITEEKKPENA